MAPIKKTLICRDPKMRAAEEFAEYWPKVLAEHAAMIHRRSRGQIELVMLTDVFRTIFTGAFIKSSGLTMEELRALDKMKESGINVLEFIKSNQELPAWSL